MEIRFDIFIQMLRVLYRNRCIKNSKGNITTSKVVSCCLLDLTFVKVFENSQVSETMRDSMDDLKITASL
jgi:hypothetical protein